MAVMERARHLLFTDAAELADGLAPEFYSGSINLDLDLTGVFDELLAKMQGDEWRPKVDQLFHATPKELGEAAVKQAKPVDSDTRYDDMDMGYRQTHNK